MKPILLATTSKYKRALFERLELPFKMAAPPFEESNIPGKTPQELAKELAEGKARSLGEQYPEHLIIGADQVLALGEEIFNKPGNVDKAVAQLQQLSGKTHCLHTAYVIYIPETDEIISDVVTAHLAFHGNLSAGFLREMVEKDQTWDCVGGYKYESRGIFLMEKVETPDTNTIVGLPLLSLIHNLRKLGYYPGHTETPFN